MSPQSHRANASLWLADHCVSLHEMVNNPRITQEIDKKKGYKRDCDVSERQSKRGCENPPKNEGEKRMVVAFETPRGDEFTSCLFYATSATAKLTGPERSGDILPIIVGLNGSLLQPIVEKKKGRNFLCSTWSGANNDQNPSAMYRVLIMKGQNQPAVACPASLSELTLKPSFVSSVFRSLMFREAVTFN